MKIVTDKWPDEGEVFLMDATLTYVQNPDCTEGQDAEPQEITISTRDNGVGKFLNVKTNNWSIDNSDELTDIIEDFKQRIINYGK